MAGMVVCGDGGISGDGTWIGRQVFLAGMGMAAISWMMNRWMMDDKQAKSAPVSGSIGSPINTSNTGKLDTQATSGPNTNRKRRLFDRVIGTWLSSRYLSDRYLAVYRGVKTGVSNPINQEPSNFRGAHQPKPKRKTEKQVKNGPRNLPINGAEIILQTGAEK